VSSSTDGGTVDGLSWNVGQLNPGETKTLKIGYGESTTSVIPVWLPNSTSIGMLVLTALALAAAAAALRQQAGLVNVGVFS
jgi:hypothetical protein